MASESFEIEGANEIIDALDSLNSNEILNIIKAVERKALKENITTPLGSAVPYSSQTKKAIGIVQDKHDRLAFFGGFTSDAFYIRFVEYGTNVRTTKKGFNRGSISATPMAKDVILNQVDDVIKFFTEDFGTAVEQQLEKRIKKINK
jgi:hypothetical protein